MQPARLTAEVKPYKTENGAEIKGNIWMTTGEKGKQGWINAHGTTLTLQSVSLQESLLTDSILIRSTFHIPQPPLFSLSVYRWLFYYFWPWLNETEDSPPMESFWGSNQHFTDYMHPLSPNEWSLASSSGFNLACWLSPPMKWRSFDLPNCCVWNEGRSGNHICLLHLSLQNQLAQLAYTGFLLLCAYICLFNEAWSAVFLEERNKPSQMRHLASLSTWPTHSQNWSKQACSPNVFDCWPSSHCKQILLKWKTIQTSEGQSCALNQIR